jgi:hypothetical protein
MLSRHRKIVGSATLGMIFLVSLAACSGGGGSGGNVMNPPPSPVPSGSPVLTGTMNVASGTYPTFSENPAGNAAVVFSCGCTTQAGTATTSNSGTFMLVADSTPTPSAPDPTYTIVPGRNYLIVATDSTGQEAWDLEYAGHIPSRNQYLNGTDTSDVYSTAVSLYIFDYSRAGDTAFDNWNFNQIRNWYQVLNGTAGTPNSAEQKLLNDIAGAGNNTLYPTAPSWDPTHATNGTIATDLTNVHSSGDKAIPTPCPQSACTGTPTP